MVAAPLQRGCNLMETSIELEEVSIERAALMLQWSRDAIQLARAHCLSSEELQMALRMLLKRNSYEPTE